GSRAGPHSLLLQPTRPAKAPAVPAARRAETRVPSRLTMLHPLMQHPLQPVAPPVAPRCSCARRRRSDAVARDGRLAAPDEFFDVLLVTGGSRALTKWHGAVIVRGR